MPKKTCTVTIDAAQKKVLGQVFDGDRLAGQQAWYLGRLINQQPAEVDRLVRRKYASWAGAYGVPEDEIVYESGPLPESDSDE